MHMPVVGFILDDSCSKPEQLSSILSVNEYVWIHPSVPDKCVKSSGLLQFRSDHSNTPQPGLQDMQPPEPWLHCF